MDAYGEAIKYRILAALRAYPQGLTLLDLSKILGVHRQTIAKYILVLEAHDLIYRRKIGPATLQYLKENFVPLDLKNILKNAKAQKKMGPNAGGRNP